MSLLLPQSRTLSVSLFLILLTLSAVPRVRKVRNIRAERRLLSTILKGPEPSALRHLSHVPQQARQTATLHIQPRSEVSPLLTEAPLVPKAARSRALEHIICLSKKPKQATSFLKANGMNYGWPKFVRILEEKDRYPNGCLIGRMILKVWSSFTFPFGNWMDTLHAHQRGNTGLE